MKKGKTSLSDPWDYERPPPPIAPLMINPLDDQTGPLHPCRFAGKRAGVVVRLPVADSAKLTPQANTNILAALIKLMEDTSLFTVFHNRGISLDASYFEREPYMTNFSDGTRKVFVRGNYTDAIDAIALAFRDAQRVSKDAATVLSSLGISSYIQ
jgi:hypothetical protein